MDELTDPDPALAPATPRPRADVGRAVLTVTGWNLVSRVTGFGRVLATAGALGVVALGDTYQRANLVSNILFELLAGGLLFSVLVPTFVALVDRGRRDEASALAGVLLTRALVLLAVLAVLGIAAGRLVMGLLTAGVPDGPARDDQVALGAFLLWFVMPQLLLYALGAVSTALLQADRRFTAAAVAPIGNNLVVIATMIAFAAVHDPADGLSLSTGEKVLLGGGTLAGTVALALFPFLAARRAGLPLRPRWHAADGIDLGAMVRKGMWGAGDIGLNQVMVAATIVFAGGVAGGVIAYQTAFTFFLLPHAVLAHPIFTTLFPRLSAHGATADHEAFASELAAGARAMVLLLAPAAALLAVVALPALTLVRFGQVDARGAQLIAGVLAAYTVGLLGYSGFFLLTRASYALDDVRAPTMVYLWATLAAVVGMAILARLVDGDARVIGLGLVHGTAVTLATVALFLRVRRRLGQPLPVGAALLRAGVGVAIGAPTAWAVVHVIGWQSRSAAATASLAGIGVGVAVYVVALRALGAPELVPVLVRLRRR